MLLYIGPLSQLAWLAQTPFNCIRFFFCEKPAVISVYAEQKPPQRIDLFSFLAILVVYAGGIKPGLPSLWELRFGIRSGRSVASHHDKLLRTLQRVDSRHFGCQFSCFQGITNLVVVLVRDPMGIQSTNAQPCNATFLISSSSPFENMQMVHVPDN